MPCACRPPTPGAWTPGLRFAAQLFEYLMPAAQRLKPRRCCKHGSLLSRMMRGSSSLPAVRDAKCAGATASAAAAGGSRHSRCALAIARHRCPSAQLSATRRRTPGGPNSRPQLNQAASWPPWPWSSTWMSLMVAASHRNKQQRRQAAHSRPPTLPPPPPPCRPSRRGAPPRCSCCAASCSALRRNAIGTNTTRPATSCWLW